MAPRKPFRREVFLLRTLVGIFVFEFLLLGFSFHKCAERVGKSQDSGIQDVCPELGGRAETLFGVAIATTLSLMGSKNSSEGM